MNDSADVDISDRGYREADDSSLSVVLAWTSEADARDQADSRFSYPRCFKDRRVLACREPLHLTPTSLPSSLAKVPAV
ncbi:hypothetical protein CA13_16010 [Planctomycetes bacterium CA13]|uniref:Uncharacterized protein n=1 Tax=Novipirellula herctigrandis TaxID=2527986 RepID=A0A5C5YYL6_9BACT|nr:hypothetical protein CA13_16010 [Planctomycetes bacterium CA13]